MLRLLLAGLVATGVLTLIGPALAVQRVQDATDAIDHIVKSQRLIALTQESLIRADRALVASFDDQSVEVLGRGVGYENAVATAGRRLAQLAEHSVADTAESRNIQLTQGLLISYLALAGKVESYLRIDAQALAAAYLSYASHLLYLEILPKLKELLHSNANAYDEILAAGPESQLTWVLWLLPVVMFLCGLVGVQILLARRFRRLLSLLFVAATALVLAVGVVAATPWLAGDQLREERKYTHDFAYFDQQAASAQAQLLPVVEGQCPKCLLDQPVSTAGGVKAKVSVPDFTRAQVIMEGVASGSIGWTSLLAVLATISSVLGLVPRLREYQR
ncbi:hypothetical protein [Catellatospora sp. TT07R-123]|uniref:hypothetical protein n=1 Tax=Catellatospora sp. TT07R-123 TaxID=2733863 RepID=UPI001BB42A84|nr:hypothetical protein [Catellatospora sp. TT07R-123]